MAGLRPSETKVVPSDATIILEMALIDTSSLFPKRAVSVMVKVGSKFEPTPEPPGELQELRMKAEMIAVKLIFLIMNLKFVEKGTIHAIYHNRNLDARVSSLTLFSTQITSVH